MSLGAGATPEQPLSVRSGLGAGTCEALAKPLDLVLQLHNKVDELHQHLIEVHLPLGSDVIEQSLEMLSSLSVLHAAGS